MHSLKSNLTLLCAQKSFVNYNTLYLYLHYLNRMQTIQLKLILFIILIL